MERINIPQNWDTLCSHVGQGRHNGDPLVAPLVQSSTFCREDADSTTEHAYSRVSNPTVAALETALGQLEDAPPAVAYASGLAAESALFMALLSRGDHMVCSRAAYGGTTRLLQQLLSGLGIETSFVDTTRAEAVAAAIRENTRLLFIETPANPTLDLSDIHATADIAHDAGVRLAVDNTFMTQILQQPLELGADISVYSTTKFIEGHSVALGGAVVCRDDETLERLRFVRKCTGGIQTPFNAWLTIQGIKTLPLRIRRQSETAKRVAEWLSECPHVARVCYPTVGDTSRPDFIKRQHLGHHGAVVAFELAGGSKPARRLLGHVEIIRFVEHVGSVDSLITHPATMTHADVPPQQRESVGVTEGLLRLSVGLEDADDIIADLDQAIDRANRQVFDKPKEGSRCLTTA